MSLDPAFVENPTIVVENASKWFGQKVAVSHLSCSFGPGVTGLLGPNGAGKTSLLRMISGLTNVSNGTVRVLGKDPRQTSDVFKSMVFVPDEESVHDDLTARRYVRYAAQLSGTDSSEAAVTRSLGDVAMLDDADRPISEYSKGMRQRTKVAAALVSDPEIVILDEPLNGTDPVQRARLIGLFQELGERGRTVIISSHILEEVERVSSRVVAIVDGRLAAAGGVDAIRAAMYDIAYRVRITTDMPRDLGAALFTQGVVDTVEASEETLDLRTTDVARLGREVPRLAVELGATLTGFSPQDASLESVFRYLVEKR